MSLTPGTRLGRYEIRSRLGAGGMAEVYLAEDLQLRRRVALKVLPSDATFDDGAEKRLLREARAAAALDHPHISAVYDVGDAGGRRFIAMQYIEGETLDVHLKARPLEVDRVLELAADVADALAAAHAGGIVHRDIKPANIIVTPQSGAVVLDFGLAKSASCGEAARAEAATASAISMPGVVMGTVPYMSPEQVRGEDLDGRSDIFSFGVMLYEMASGRRPFAESSPAATASAILTKEPPPLARNANDLPPELGRIVAKAMRKDVDERYQSANDLLVDLRALRDSRAFRRRRVSARAFRTPAIVAVLLLVVAITGQWAWRWEQTRAAAARLPQLETLADAGRYAEAYALALDIERQRPTGPTLSRLLASVSMTVSARSTPAGARVYLKAFVDGDNGRVAERRLIGRTPLADVRVARGRYVISVEQDGYVTYERTVSGIPLRASNLVMSPPPVLVDVRMIPVSGSPARMVFVPGGGYRLVAWSRPTDRRVALGDFFIDKYEVSNEEFKAFIRAGGYLKPEFWKVPFIKDGKTLSWDSAMKLLVDRTGLSGPRSWSGQNVPDAKGDHPVTDITWYEAAAYAAFRGKQLPTVYQWEKAARDGLSGGPVTYMPWGVFYPGDALERHANFSGRGTLPVTALEFGMSPVGAYNMAGNVSEWTASHSSDGYFSTGGAWGEPAYVFGQFARLPGLLSSDRLGFRCVMPAPGAASDTGGGVIDVAQEIPKYTRSRDADFATWSEAYQYDARPLDARIDSTEETPDWTREKISFTGANGKRVLAYLFLPHNFARPLQVVHFVPAGDVDNGLRSLPDSMADRLAATIKSGRAAFGVVLEGYIERLRPAGFTRPDTSTIEYVEVTASRVIDLRRGLDYLGTRIDVDPHAIAFCGPSSGAQLGLILAAVESRYRGVALLGAGLPGSYRQIIAAANPINFASHIRGPKLMLQGKYDEDSPLKTAAEPLYALLPQPKRLITYEGGHVASTDLAFTVLKAWFDEVMGPVR